MPRCLVLVLVLVPVPVLVLAGPAAAAVPASHARKNPVCARDLSGAAFPDVRPRLGMPPGLVGRVLRPGLLRMQEDLCACLPRKRRRQPGAATVELRVQPRQGRVAVAWRVDAPLDKARLRLQRCLGAPAWEVPPLAYQSDMVVEGRTLDEVLRYPLLFVLADVAPERDRQRPGSP